MELNNKCVLVVGLGKSGVASALFLKAHGARVTVSDTKSTDELKSEIPIARPGDYGRDGWAWGAHVSRAGPHCGQSGGTGQRAVAGASSWPGREGHWRNRTGRGVFSGEDRCYNWIQR